MRLKHLELSEFKQHRKLSRNLDAETVGITGLNHTGKTTLLRGIRWLLTGKLDGPQAHHVYGYSQLGVETATGSLTFEKGGHEGTITRSLGASSKRTLVWDGIEYKKSADVDEKMEEILGADLGTIDKVMFIRQGELASALFGTPADRERLFMTILDVGYLYKSADALDEKIRIYEAGGVQNLSELLDTLSAAMEEGQKTIRELAAKLIARKGSVRDLQRLRLLKELLDKGVYIAKEIRGANGRLNMLQESLVSKSTPAELRLVISNLNEDKSRINEVVQRLDQNKRNAEAKSYWEDRLNSQLLEMEASGAKLGILAKEEKDIRDAWEFGKEVFAYLASPNGSLIFDTVKNLRVNEQCLEDLIPKLEYENNRKEIAEAALKDVEALVRTRTQEQSLSAYALQFVRLRKEGLSCCPMCASSLDSAVDPDAEKFAEDNNRQAQNNLNEAKVLHADLGSQFLKIHSACAQLETGRRETQARVIKLSEQVVKFFGNESPEKVLETFASANAALTVNRNNSVELQQAFEKASKAVDMHRDTLSVIPPIEDISSPEGLDEKLEELSTKIAKFEQDLSAIEKVHALMAEIKQSVSSMMASAQQNSLLLEASLPDTDFEYVETCRKYPGVLEKDIERAEAMVKESNELEGALNAYKGQLDGIRKKYEEAQAKAHENAVKEDFINQLKQVRDVFRKGALPTLYVERKFGELCEASKEFLGRTDATFEIERDTNNTVGFLFRELDSETPVWQPQENLSGGQKVRLSIAFLIAVQQILVPDIGLLVLDEPTQHVDEPGVESLQELFGGMGEILASSDSQIIICDHNEKLIPAYKIHINL